MSTGSGKIAFFVFCKLTQPVICYMFLFEWQYR